MIDKIEKVNEKEYIIQKKENSKTELMRFNHKYGKWVHINFSDNSTSAIEERIIEILSRQYIQRNMQNKEYKFIKY